MRAWKSSPITGAQCGEEIGATPMLSLLLKKLKSFIVTFEQGTSAQIEKHTTLLYCYTSHSKSDEGAVTQ